jgi:PAS domain S-box-containing protein
MGLREIKGEELKQLSHITVEKACVGVVWADLDWQIYRSNEAASKILGYRPEEMIRLKVTDLGVESFKYGKSQAFMDRLRKEGHLQFETSVRRKDGSIFPAEAFPQYVKLQETEFCCIFIIDITDRKQAESELKQALAEVEALKNRLQDEKAYLQEEIRSEHNFEEIIGSGKAIQNVLAQLEQVAATDATILLHGETGTGKELIARAAHKLSTRKERPLVKVNCAALPASLIESELFGHERGAFTGATARKIGRFELANKGTIFLDEIGDLPMEIQVKLLRVLQESEFERLGGTQTLAVDVRVIAATNKDLKTLVAEGIFREDLYYRLNVFPLECPPLRERREDIPILVRHFVQKFAASIGKQIDQIPQRVMDTLIAYNWPGNVRELQNIIQRAVVLSRANRLKLDASFDHESPVPATHNLETLEAHEQRHIIRVLEKTEWRVSGEKGAARILGLKDQTLFSKMRKYGIKRKS